jgi:F-type H+-transporting ATPase subunit b
MLPNYTFFVQLGLFFLTYFILNKFVFGPYLHLLEVRKAKTSDLKLKAIQDKEVAQNLKVDYEVKMKAERQKLNAWMDEERKKISEEERKIVQEARQKVGKEFSDLKAIMDKEENEIRKTLNPMVADFSSQIASKLMGKKVQVSVSSVDEATISKTLETTA